MRYAQPRKLTTKRGKLKAAQNAWCVSCRQPMAKHGKNFTCSDCHVATRIAITNGRGRNAEIIRQGILNSANLKLTYPSCAACRVRMHRLSRNSVGKPPAFRCRQCKSITSSHIERGPVHTREEQILELLRAGYLDSQIVRLMKCHHKTVKRLRADVNDARRCECGQLFHHSGKCRVKPGWQTRARERRDDFDNLLVRINRRLPSSFPEEMRDDICQEMLLEVMNSIDRILARTPQFISEYKKRYPFQYYSLDGNPNLIDRIAG